MKLIAVPPFNFFFDFLWFLLFVFCVFFYSTPSRIFESGLFKIFVKFVLSNTLCSNVCAIFIASVGHASIHKLQNVQSSR